MENEKNTLTPPLLFLSPTWSQFASPANQNPKSTIKKKAHRPCCVDHMCLIIIKSCYCDYKQTFHMFSLLDLRFVFCSRDLDVLRAQRIIAVFIFITHKSTRSAILITCLNFALFISAFLSCYCNVPPCTSDKTTCTAEYACFIEFRANTSTTYAGCLSSVDQSALCPRRTMDDIEYLALCCHDDMCNLPRARQGVTFILCHNGSCLCSICWRFHTKKQIFESNHL